MNVDLGFNVNSFQAKKGQSSLSQSNSGDKGGDFKSQLNDTKSIGSKPVPDSGPMSGIGSNMSGFPSSTNRSVDEVISTQKESSKIQDLSSEKIDTLTRRVAWQRFLQKMDSELGVSAEDIMFAFQSLTPEELAQPPENNVEKLVDSLDLEPAQSQMAAQLFTELLSKTGSRPLSQELVASQRDINLTVMSQREQDQRRLSETLDRMNQQFFMKDQPKTKKAEGQETNGTSAASSMMASASASGAGMEIPAEMTPVTDGSTSHEMISDVVNPFRVATQTDAPSSANDFFNVDKAEKTQKANGSEAVVQTASTTPQQAVVQPATTLTGLQMLNINKDSNVSEESEDSFLGEVKSSEQAPVVSASSEVQKTTLEKDLSKDENSSDSATLTQTNVDPTAFKVERASNSEFQNLMSTVAAGDVGQAQNMSTEDLIQKAQVMVRDGGGEVKVILQPEGLGEVAMKISVHGDKVNVEMITESDQAKKLLEKSMVDLKGHLHASNLNLESIKVDTASSMGQQLEQQYQDAHRNQAQQFMEQFRQNNQEFRRGMFEMPGAKIYKGQTEDASAAVVAASKSNSKGARRLNLVA